MDYQEMLAAAFAFFHEHWYAAPIVLALLTIANGLVNRSKRKQIAKDAADEIRRKEQQFEQQLREMKLTATEAATPRELSPAEKLVNILRNAIQTSDWKLTEPDVGTSVSLQCDKFIIRLTKLVNSTPSVSSIGCGGESILTTVLKEDSKPRPYNSDSTMMMIATLYKIKSRQAEEDRLAKIMTTLDSKPTVKESYASVQVKSAALANDSEKRPALRPNDINFGKEAYEQLTRLFGDTKRFATPAGGDPNQFSDNKLVVFKSYGPTEAEIWTSGVLITPFLTDEQNEELADACYRIATSHPMRISALDKILSTLKAVDGGKTFQGAV